MLLIEEPVADPDLAESLGARYLGPNASAASPLLRQPHPVVPVTADQSEMSIKNTVWSREHLSTNHSSPASPLHHQLLPHLLGQHPAQAGEEVSSE